MADDDDIDEPNDEPNDDSSSQSIDSATGFDINFQEIPDETTQKAVKRLLTERDQLKAEMKEVTQTLRKMNEREERKQFETQRNTKLKTLRDLNPQLADKHKDESSIDKLDLLIDTAKSFKSDFAEYKTDSDDDKPDRPPMRRDLKTGDFI